MNPNSKYESDSEIAENGVPHGIKLQYKGSGCVTPSGKKDYNLAVSLMCNKTMTTTTFSSGGEVGGDPCTIDLKYESKDGCPLFSAGQLWAFLAKYKYLWGAALILLGLSVAFYGSALLTFLFFIVAALATFLFGCWAIYAII